MIGSHIAGPIAIAIIAVAWTGVQRAWRRAFPAAPCDDPDALAGRIGCHGPDCSRRCDRRGPDAVPAEEGRP